MGPLAVAIMAKTPRAGEVKTRLSPPLSAPEAAELYCCFLLDKIEQVRALRNARPAIAYTPEGGRAFFEAAAPDFLLIPQRGEDLGARLYGTFEALFVQGYAGGLAIDSDTPTLPTGYLQQAVDLLAGPRADLVLGPCEDGGYYLIGLHRLQRPLFEGIAWSTDQVLPETIRRAEALGLTVASLPPWLDIDTPGDLERLRDALASTKTDLPRHTRHFFRERRR